VNTIRRGSGGPLPRSFFQRSTLTVARDLLGKTLVHDTGGACLTGRIVEVEAYCGARDRAAHSRGGHRSARNESMWGPPGHAYVYLIYGVHHCLNVVTREAGVPEAVLVRAIEPLDGIESMRHRREIAASPDWRLCRGPGSLCRAFDVDRSHDGTDLLAGPLRLLDAPPVSSRAIRRTPRIGVAYAGPDAARPWRFLLAGSRAVSGRRVQ
jgi:DNA-3-methyladenine glycosylase